MRTHNALKQIGVSVFLGVALSGCDLLLQLAVLHGATECQWQDVDHPVSSCLGDIVSSITGSSHPGDNDSFVLLNPPDGVAVALTKNVSPGAGNYLVFETTGKVAPVWQRRVDWIYSHSVGGSVQTHTGYLLLDTVGQLFVTTFVLEGLDVARQVHPGQSVHLVARASGGLPPYSFSWMPAESLDDPTSATPVATPRAPLTLYTASVRDSSGQAARADDFFVRLVPHLTVVNNFAGVAWEGIDPPLPLGPSDRPFDFDESADLFTDGPASWSGCDFVADTNQHCTLIMNADRTVTISPPSAGFTLTITNNAFGSLGPVVADYRCPSGSFFGAGTSSCPGIPARTTVTLVDESFSPATWNGCDSIDTSRARCTVVMNADRTVTVSP